MRSLCSWDEATRDLRQCLITIDSVSNPLQEPVRELLENLYHTFMRPSSMSTPMTKVKSPPSEDICNALLIRACWRKADLPFKGSVSQSCSLTHTLYVNMRLHMRMHASLDQFERDAQGSNSPWGILPFTGLHAGLLLLLLYNIL